MRTLISSAMLLWLTACSTSSSDDSYVNPTFLQVAPSEFPTPPQCDPASSGAAGTYGSYIATLVDVTETDGGMPYKAENRFVSPPVSCRSGVRFSDSQAKTGHRYMAWVDAYADAANLLVRDGDTVEVGGKRVSPRYRFACGGKGVPEVESAVLPGGSIPDLPPGNASVDAALPDAGVDPGLPDTGLDAALLDASPSDAPSAAPPIAYSVNLAPPVKPVTGRTTPIRGCVLTQLPSSVEDAE